MPSKRRQLRPTDYGRCANCGRLTEKSSLSSMNGVQVGPECIKGMAAKMLRAAEDDVTAEGKCPRTTD